MWHNLFLPHKDTHQKAKLISWEALVIYILLFMLLQTGFSLLGYAKPGVLGTTSSVTTKQIIELTNRERQKHGLEPLSENTTLSQAAEGKAFNMFSENYWSHFAPSGKTPWDFILSSGYKFSFAGENLAKNFSQADEVVVAWMNSPTHKDNILNPKYQDIGIAVEDGVLQGQRTTLVVQMFGATSPLLSFETKGQSSPFNEQVGGANILPQNFKPLFDPFVISKALAMVFLTLVMVLLAVDLIVLKRRGVFKIASNHLAHMAILSVALAAVFTSGRGSIL